MLTKLFLDIIAWLYEEGGNSIYIYIYIIFDNTNYDIKVIEQQVCAKGLKFVPSVKRVDRHQK